MIDPDFEVMKNDYISGKYVDSVSAHSSSLSTSPFVSVSNECLTPTKSKKSGFNSPSLNSFGFSSTQHSSFSISINDLFLDNDVVDAFKSMRNAQTDTERDCALMKLKQSELVAENQAIVEINIDNKLLEQNAEILVYSKYASNTVYERLFEGITPIYLYGIIDKKLSIEVPYHI
jgi:hypothetical protein